MIKKILLIDDDYATNEYHKIIINSTSICNDLVVFQYADEALEWLKSIEENEFPSLIFLDINMPRMNGFEFLDEYEKEFSKSVSSVIVMLTTSINPNDREKSKNYNIEGFINKPLTAELLHSMDTKLADSEEIDHSSKQNNEE